MRDYKGEWPVDWRRLAPTCSQRLLGSPPSSGRSPALSLPTTALASPVPSPQEYEALSIQNAYISLSTTQILNAGKIPSLRPRSASSRRGRAPIDPGPGAYVRSTCASEPYRRADQWESGRNTTLITAAPLPPPRGARPQTRLPPSLAPSQIDPMKEGRDENGVVKPVSSAQRCPPSIGFTKSEVSADLETSGASTTHTPALSTTNDPPLPACLRLLTYTTHPHARAVRCRKHETWPSLGRSTSLDRAW